MAIKFQQTLTLLGVVGKNGSGTLDGGKAWAHDHVELHVLTDFDSSDPKTLGQTVSVYKVEGYNANFVKASGCVGQRIVCEFEMVTSTKPGVAPRMVCRGFNAEQVRAKA